MAQKRVVQFDKETGEMLEEGFIAYIAPKRQNAFGSWIAMAQEMFMNLAKSSLNSVDNKVLYALLSKLDFENLLVVNQSELAKELGLQRQHFSRSVQKLIKEGIILQGPKIGVSRSFRLNPTIGWKGSASNHKKAVKQHLEVIRGTKK